MKINLLGINLDNLTFRQVLARLNQFLSGKKQHYIVFPYSEFIVRSQHNQEFKDLLNNADLSLCDGRGLFFGCKILNRPLKEQVAGVELVERLGEGITYPCRLFLVGAIDKVVKKTKEKLVENYPKNIKIVGAENGFQEMDKVINKINRSQANFIIVNLGSPRQEKWITENLKKMPDVKIAMGVGGAFDFLSGHIKRAPRVWRQKGLEWLWRLIHQPWRLKRQLALFEFGWLVLREKIYNKSVTQ